MRTYPIPYAPEMLACVVRMHAGAEGMPYYDQWIDAHMGGRVVAFRQRLLPQILAFTELRDMDILDFGCGTGSTTVALAEQARGCRITATDIDATALEVAKLRLQHHALSVPVRLQQIPRVQQVNDLAFADASFDFILLNGVLEHVVPFAARPRVILEVWRLLRPGGLLYISETPNALWPVDRHTTGLPLVPWLPSPLAYRLAVLAGKHRAGSDIEVRGRRGMTFWEIVRPLHRQGLAYEVLNITRAGNHVLPAGLSHSERATAKRRVGVFLLEQTAGKVLARFGVPSVALAPFIEHLGLGKPRGS